MAERRGIAEQRRGDTQQEVVFSFAFGEERPRIIEERSRIRRPAHPDHGRRIRSALRTLGSVQDETTLFDAVGGMPFFEALVDRFYDGVQHDPVLLCALSGARGSGTGAAQADPLPRAVLGRSDDLSRGARAPGACGCDTRRSRSAPTSATGGSCTCARRSTRWTRRRRSAKASDRTTSTWRRTRSGTSRSDGAYGSGPAGRGTRTRRRRRGSRSR